MPKKVLLVLAEGFEEIEAIAPIDLLRRAGIAVTVAGLSGTRIISSRGLEVGCDRALDGVKEEFDALILPGGPGAKNLAASAQVRALILEMHKKGKWICAICAAPVLVLAPTGILNGRTATCYKGMEEGFGPEVKFSAEKVVVDGNIITSRGPGTAIDFALAIIENVAEKESGRKVREAILV